MAATGMTDNEIWMRVHGIMSFYGAFLYHGMIDLDRDLLFNQIRADDDAALKQADARREKSK